MGMSMGMGIPPPGGPGGALPNPMAPPWFGTGSQYMPQGMVPGPGHMPGMMPVQGLGHAGQAPIGISRSQSGGPGAMMRGDAEGDDRGGPPTISMMRSMGSMPSGTGSMSGFGDGDMGSFGFPLSSSSFEIIRGEDDTEVTPIVPGVGTPGVAESPGQLMHSPLVNGLALGDKRAAAGDAWMSPQGPTMRMAGTSAPPATTSAPSGPSADLPMPDGHALPTSTSASAAVS